MKIAKLVVLFLLLLFYEICSSNESNKQSCGDIIPINNNGQHKLFRFIPTCSQHHYKYSIMPLPQKATLASDKREFAKINCADSSWKKEIGFIIDSTIPSYEVKIMGTNKKASCISNYINKFYSHEGCQLVEHKISQRTKTFLWFYSDDPIGYCKRTYGNKCDESSVRDLLNTPFNYWVIGSYKKYKNNRLLTKKNQAKKILSLKSWELKPEIITTTKDTEFRKELIRIKNDKLIDGIALDWESNNYSNTEVTAFVRRIKKLIGTKTLICTPNAYIGHRAFWWDDVTKNGGCDYILPMFYISQFSNGVTTADQIIDSYINNPHSAPIAKIFPMINLIDKDINQIKIPYELVDDSLCKIRKNFHGFGIYRPYAASKQTVKIIRKMITQ